MKALPRILFVDDDPEILAAYRRVYLDRYLVLTALSGPEGLALVRENQEIRVAVVDYLMPRQNGLEMLAVLAESAPRIKRILLTGLTTIDLAEEARIGGLVDLFLTKPCLPHHLAKEIDRLLES